MSNFENGRFTFEENSTQKTINLTKQFANPVVVKVTPVNKNINIYLTDVQNNYFILEKNTNEEVIVNYLVIESEP